MPKISLSPNCKKQAALGFLNRTDALQALRVKEGFGRVSSRGARRAIGS